MEQSADSVTHERLFGVPGAEVMEFDLASAYEAQIDPWMDKDDRRPRTLEEWSACNATSHLPTVDIILDHACEWASEHGCLDEDGDDAFRASADRGDVRAAFQAALDLWASKVTYRMADKLLRTHEITWDEDGYPLADGEPIYGKASPSGGRGIAE